MPNTITLEQFHTLLSKCCAVKLNGCLYSVEDDDMIRSQEEEIDLSAVDGDIELMDSTEVFFYLNAEGFRMSFLSAVILR